MVLLRRYVDLEGINEYFTNILKAADLIKRGY